MSRKLPYSVMYLLPCLALPFATEAAPLRAPEFTVSVFKRSGPPEKLELRAIPPKGNHINIEAPMSLEIEGAAEKLKAEKKGEAVTVFTVERSRLPAGKSATVKLYLCDDAKTYCEPHATTVPAQVLEKAPPAPGEPAGAGREKKPGPKGNKPAASSRALPGFVEEGVEAAFAQARKEGRPLLVEVSTIWCPACNELEAHVLRSPEFRQAAREFVKVKVDGDSSASWTTREKYVVRGYPTVLFLDSQGDEISRVVGSRPKSEFLAAVNDAWLRRATAAGSLKKKAEAGDLAARERLGMLQLERRSYAEAIALLRDCPATPVIKEALLDAEIGLADEERQRVAQGSADAKAAAEKKLQAVLERALAESPRSLQSLERRSKLADLFEEAKKAEARVLLLRENAELAETLAADAKALQGQEYTAGDLLQLAADAREGLTGDSKEADAAKALWKKAAAYYLKVAKTPLDRGPMLEAAYCLRKAGRFEEATAAYERLEKAYPEEFTFYYAHARMEAERKRWDSALEKARFAYVYSYGDNRLRAAHLLATLHRERGNLPAARSVIEETLAQAPATRHNDKLIRTGRYLVALQDLQKQL